MKSRNKPRKSRNKQRSTVISSTNPCYVKVHAVKATKMTNKVPLFLQAEQGTNKNADVKKFRYINN